MASLTVKQQIFDFLVYRENRTAESRQIYKALGAETRKENRAIAANLTQLENEGVISHCGHCLWRLSLYAKRPMSRLEREANNRKMRSFSGQFECVSAAAINALILAPVVRL